MSRTCDIKIKVDGTMIDLVERFDLHLLSSPAKINPDIKEYEEQAFPETSQVEVDPRTKKLPFDYKISLGYWGTEKDANTNIRNFFDLMFTKGPGDILTAKTIELYNYWKKVKMSGLAKAWEDKTYTINGEQGLIVFDFTIRVVDPETFVPIV